MNQPTTTTVERRYDLALLVTPSRLALVSSNGTGIVLKLAVPLGGQVEPALLRKLLGEALRSHRPRRLLLSVAGGVDHEAVLDPVTDAACAFAGHSGARLVWLPDVLALAAALDATPLTLGARLAHRFRSLAERARAEEANSRPV